MTEQPEASEKAKFSLKKRENKIAGPAGPTKPCPNCKISAPEDAVICIQCGFNFTSGKKTRTKSGKGAKIARDLALMVVVLGGLGALGYFAVTKFIPENKDLTDKLKSAVSTAKEKVNTAIDESGMKELAEEVKDAAQETSRDVKRDLLKKEVEEASSDNAEAETTVAEIAEEPPSPAPTNDVATSITAKLNNKYPFAQAGEEIILKISTGEVFRGQIVNLDKSAVMLHTESGSKKLPYDSLHKASRIRCDAAYRKAYLERLIEKKRATENPAP